MKKNLVIATSNFFFNEGLIFNLEKNRTSNLHITSFHDSNDIIEQIIGLKLDLFILDIMMDEISNYKILEFLKKRNIDFKILVLAPNNPIIIRKILEFKVDGILLYESNSIKLIESIDCIFSNKKYFDPKIEMNGIGSSAAKKIATNSYFKNFEEQFLKKNEITNRELEVLKLLANAHSNLEIGKILFISEQTVTVHRKSLMRKLCVNNIAALMKIAYENNLI
mgnify:CR=1 FL=1